LSEPNRHECQTASQAKSAVLPTIQGDIVHAPRQPAPVALSLGEQNGPMVSRLEQRRG
jgi:hypothetical protein